MPIDNFPDPFITCCFVAPDPANGAPHDLIFVNLFHNKLKEHHHFFYCPATGMITYKTKIVLHDSNNKNFPVKCFYNTEYNEIYTFYRQGTSYRVPVFDIDC